MIEKELAVIVGENITLQRKKLGMSQKELADRLNITQDAMSRMEKGKIAPKLSRFQELSRILECSASYLLCTHDERNDEIAHMIAEIIRPIPEQGQRALLEFITSTAKLVEDSKN